MVTIDEDTKKKVSKFLDSDGKILLSEDMPEDLKVAIKFLNANNVNLFAENDSLADAIEDDELNESDDEDDDLDLDSSSDESSDESNDYVIEENDDVETDSLSNLF